MASTPLSFKFKDDLNALDYQKIIVEQNNTIINLLAMQQDNIFHGALNQVVKNNYTNALKPYLANNSPDGVERLSSRKQNILNGLKKRKANGEDISELIEHFGLQGHIEP